MPYERQKQIKINNEITVSVSFTVVRDGESKLSYTCPDKEISTTIVSLELWPTVPGSNGISLLLCSLCGHCAGLKRIQWVFSFTPVTSSRAIFANYHLMTYVTYVTFVLVFSSFFRRKFVKFIGKVMLILLCLGPPHTSEIIVDPKKLSITKKPVCEASY